MLTDKFKFRKVNKENLVDEVDLKESTSEPIEIKDETPVKTLEWLLTILLVSIPIIGWIPSIYMVFSKRSNYSKKNFCKAYMIYQTILLVIVLFIMGVAINVLATLAEFFLKQFG